jgi:hypothetical protein
MNWRNNMHDLTTQDLKTSLENEIQHVLDNISKAKLRHAKDGIELKEYIKDSKARILELKSELKQVVDNQNEIKKDLGIE